MDRELRKSGIAVSEKRVLHIMQKLGLAGRGATRKHRIQKRVEPGDPRLNLADVYVKQAMNKVARAI
ncbi:hypothetical protein [uncultured Senegalimassilia sp.]|uniref:hypothetical protein n=1 Tax=uncultured Senegalimassilia sp. TaxID=1714350 RepID=UPI00341930C1